MYSCLKEEELLIDSQEQSVNVKEEEYKPTGKILKNPYEITIMQAAYDTVMSRVNKKNIKASKGALTFKKKRITSNYLYIRFDPKNLKQEARLKDKKKFVVIDYPFEYDNPEDYRKTNPLKEGEINSYWTSVPAHIKLPKNIPYTILQEMYMPEEDDSLNKQALEGKGEAKTARGQINDEIDFLNHLLEEAYEVTNKEDLLSEYEENKKGNCETCFLGINLRSRWYPSARIEIWDDNITTRRTRRIFVENEVDYNCNDYELMEELYERYYDGEAISGPCTLPVYRTETTTEQGGYTPLAQANVLVRDTWTLDSRITDNNGYCRFKRLRAKVKYVIQWDRHEFSIRDNSGLFQAEDNGPKLHKQQWNHKIRGGREQYRGHIFQAAHHYYYGNIGGLTRPPANGVLKTQMKIAAIEERGVSSHKPIARWLGIAPRIKVKRWGLSSEEVFGVTIHELAHAAHWNVDQGAYSNTVFNAYIGNHLLLPRFGSQEDNSRRFLESWATGVEIFLTNLYYRNLGNVNYRYLSFQLEGIDSGNFQNQTIGGERHYTSAVFDMTDDFNQRVDFGVNYVNLPIDNVSGLSMAQLEKGLKDRVSWTSYRDKLVSLYPEQATEIRELFNNW